MLSRIKHLLSEAASNEEFNLNDAKGKLFEILAGSHLRHGADKNGKPAGFLTHYRDQDNKTPEAVHDYIKREMNRRHPGMYDQINQHANEAASHMRNQMAADGHTEFHDVAWTSQPSDHKSFTGVEDPNSDADVMVRTNKGHVGVSLKYGSQKIPNLRNPGLQSIESLANLKKGEVTDLYDGHQQNVKRYGYNGTAAQNHEAYKANKGSESAKAAEESSLAARRAIAKKWQDGYSQMSSDELRDKIVSLVSPETKFKHYRLHTRPTASGVEHNMAGVQEEVRNSLNDYAEFKAVPHSGEGITAQILGRHHDSDEWHPVVNHSVKGVSGPMKGFAGTTKLKLRKPKAPKAAKSTSKTPTSTPASTSRPAKPRAVKKPTPKAKPISKAKPIDIPPMDTSRPLSARLGESYLRKIIKESKMADDKKSAEEKGEYDYEGDMAKSQLKSIITNAQRMHDMLEETTNLPEWVQSKITLAEDYILTATSYMEGEMSEEYSIQEKINIANSDMGKVIKDFKASDAPQFKGRSKKKRREMAIAAKLDAMRKSKMSEELKGNQHKIDANRNGKIDPQDFNLLRSKLKAKVNKEEMAWDGTTEREVTHYNIVHKPTGRVVGRARTMKAANSARNRRDTDYGSAAHSVIPVWKEEVEQIGEAPYIDKPGWMLRDPKLAAKIKEIKDRKKNMDSLMKKYGGKTGDEIAKMNTEEASPMIKPPSDRFGDREAAFKYAKDNGGTVHRHVYINPRTGMKSTTYSVK